MEILEAITGRYSARAFLDKPVDDTVITQILEAAKRAPSGVNTQPWIVHVVKDPMKLAISHAILDERVQNNPPNPDFAYYPTEWFEPYKTRRKECGQAMYGALNIEINNEEKRLLQWNKNYVFFGAPIGLFFFLDKKLSTGAWLDMGMFLQNVMLAARAFDLDTCAQASMSDYPDVVRRLLGVSNDFHLVCGMALGHANTEDIVNQYRTERVKNEEFIFWHSF